MAVRRRGMTGIYKVSVMENGLDEVGDYTLGVNCLYGACTSSAPAPVPEPETYTMLLAGLGLLSMVVRRRTKH